MLHPEYAELYPELPTGFWIDAWYAAMKQADRLWLDVGAGALASSRVLRDEHFQFRGGRPRGVRIPIRERVSDAASPLLPATGTFSDLS
jgi:hypothetical protein